MKEITQVMTIEVTNIERINDDQMFDDLEQAKENVRECVKSLFAACDDVRTDVKFFVRDLDMIRKEMENEKAAD